MQPDRFGNLYPTSHGPGSMLGVQGFRVIEDPCMVQTKLRPQERKWAHRKMWKRAQRFKFIPYQVPSDQMIKMDDKLIMHPATAKRLRDAIENQSKPNTFSMGAKVDASQFTDKVDYNIPTFRAPR